MNINKLNHALAKEWRASDSVQALMRMFLQNAYHHFNSGNRCQ